MASIIHSLAVSGSRLSDGTVNAGGRVFLTQPGSANVKVTGYADKDKTAALTLNGGGYLLDAAGKIAVFVDQPCVVRIEDQDGVTVDSFSTESTTSSGLVEVVSPYFTGVDSTSGQYVAGKRTYLARVLGLIGASAGGVDGNFLAGTSATGRYIKDAINDVGISVKSFGAKGNGVADDALAIQTTINFVASLGGGVVLFPPGTYIISAALTVATAGISIRGTGAAVNIRSSNTTANAFTVTATNTSFSDVGITCASASSGTAISCSVAALVTVLSNVTVTGFKNSIVHAGSRCYVINSTLATQNGGGGAITAGTGSLYVIDSTTSGIGTDVGISAGGPTFILGSAASGGAVGVDILANASLFAAGSSSSSTTGLRINATAYEVRDNGCDWGAVLDSRTGAPMGYSFSTNSSVTPLPTQSETVRIIATAAITVTIGAATTGVHGQPLTLLCLNNSGGAVVWTFNAQYKTSGALAPATGNGIAITFKYDAVSSVYREVTRSAAVPI